MDNTNKQSKVANLRKKAETLLRINAAEIGLPLSEIETLKLIHELEVHQIELEMQNDELMLASSAAQEAAQKYSELYDFAPSGYFTLSKEGKVIELNHSGAKMLGKERWRLKNSLFGFFVSNDTKPIFNRFLEKVFNSKTKESCEVILSVNDNLPTFVQLTGIAFKNGEQCLLTVIEITELKQTEQELIIANKELAFQNKEKENRAAELIIANKEFASQITKHNQAEEALKKSEESFRTIFENSTIGIYRTTPDGQILLANPTLFKLLGYSSFEELAARNLAEEGFVPSYERTHFMDILNREGEVKGLESAWTKTNGTILFISESARAIKDKEGKIIYYDGIVEDITLRKKAEQELIIANKELVFQNDEKQKRVAELIIANEEKEKRAAELIIANTELAFQNKEKEKRAVELIIAKEKAEESDRLKTAFLYNISHEIRTPFNGILGFLSIIQDYELQDTERDEYIGIINQSADRLMNTINEIVEISQIQAGQMQVTTSEINIIMLIGELIDQFKYFTEIQKLKFNINNELPNKITCISTDGIKLKTILSNLVGNAFKFTKAGSIELKIRQKGDYLEFSIKDSGIGFPENKIKIIFERFMQADVSKTREYEGLGLGLSIATAYVKMLGGKIWAKSEVGKGSTFFFTIKCNIKPE